MKATGAAHGKVILLGEHVVVYGAPALATRIRARRAPTASTLGPGNGSHLDLGWTPSFP